MINFIICEDNKHVRELNENLISKIAMPHDFNYVVHSFEKYNIKLKNIINTPSDVKVYILDLELPNKSGIDIAREIRKIDWDSIIIILTSHDELEMKVLKEKLLIFDFISKFDDYEKRLVETVNMIIKKVDVKKVLSFKCNKEIHYVKYDNILYINKDTFTEKTKIVTIDNEYLIRESLQNIAKKLDSRFIQTHRACYVNLEKIETVDFKTNVIYFVHNKSTDYLSRNFKKGLKGKLWPKLLFVFFKHWYNV